MHFATKAALAAYIKDNQDAEYLVIDGFDALGDLEELTDLPPALYSLTISNCVNLKRVRVVNVKEVWIGTCPNLEVFEADERLMSLSLYRLQRMDDPASLPDSIEYLRIENCPGMTRLSTIPTQLKDLTLIDNPHLGFVAPRSASVFTVIDGCPGLFR